MSDYNENTDGIQQIQCENLVCLDISDTRMTYMASPNEPPEESTESQYDSITKSVVKKTEKDQEKVTIESLKTVLLENAKEKAPTLDSVEAIAEYMNKYHATIRHPFNYLTEIIDPSTGQKEFFLEDKQAFKNAYEHLTITIDKKKQTYAEVFLKNPTRRNYLKIVFDTENKTENKGCYNIWNGFSFKPKKADTSIFWNFVNEAICAGDSKIYYHVKKWFAKVFQKPHLLHTALVLIGSQGTGKNTLVDTIGRLLGKHYTSMSTLAELTSNFNYHQKNTILAFINEAIWGGDKKYLGLIKSLITDSKQSIEQKGKDRISYKNHKHFIFASNDSFPVAMDHDDRRFFTINVSDIYKGNKPFFKKLYDWIDAPGSLEGLLFDLLNEDISDFDPKGHMPKTDSSFDSKLRTEGSFWNWMYSALDNGHFNVGQRSKASAEWVPSMPKSTFRNDYMCWCEINKEKTIISEVEFWKIIKEVFKSIKTSRLTTNGERINNYIFPALKTIRKEFEIFFEVSDNIWTNEG